MTSPTQTPDVNKSGRKRLTIIIAAIIVVVALIVAGVWWGVASHHSRQLAEAKTLCAQASEQRRVAMNAYDTYHEGEAAQAKTISVKDTGDEKVVTALADVYEVEPPQLVACNTSDAQQLRERAETIGKDADWYETRLAELKTATVNVTDARDAKRVKDAQEALAKKLEAAKKLVDSSHNKVADNKTRDTLNKQVDAAGKLKGSTDVDALTKQTKALADAMKKVEDSVKQKQEADRKAKEEAERQAQEAAAAAAAQAQAQQSYTPSYSPSYTQTYVQPQQQSYTPTYTAPQQSYTAPQQSTPQQSVNNGGGSAVDTHSGALGCSNDGTNCAGTTDDGINHFG